MNYENIIQSSVIVCPICGGPTHLNRDTGDFVCDHCGKIIVRASKSNWVPSVFDIQESENFDVIASNSRESRAFLHDLLKRGWDLKPAGKSATKATWPHFTTPQFEGDKNWISVHSTPNRQTLRNIMAFADRMEKLHPRPNDVTEKKPQNKEYDFDQSAERAKQRALQAEQRLIGQNPSVQNITPQPTQTPQQEEEPKLSIDERMQALKDRLNGPAQNYYKSCGGSSGSRMHLSKGDNECDYCKLGKWAERQLALGRAGNPGKMYQSTKNALDNIQAEDPDNPRHKPGYDRSMALYTQANTAPSEGVTSMRYDNYIKPWYER